MSAALGDIYEEEFKAAEIEFYGVVNEEIARMHTVLRAKNHVFPPCIQAQVSNENFAIFLMAIKFLQDCETSSAYILLLLGAVQNNCNCFITLGQWYSRAYSRLEMKEEKSDDEQIAMRKCLLLGLYWAGRALQNRLPTKYHQKLQVSHFVYLFNIIMKLWHGEKCCNIRKYLKKPGHIPFIVSVLNKWRNVIRTLGGFSLEKYIGEGGQAIYVDKDDADKIETTNIVSTVLKVMQLKVESFGDWLYKVYGSC